MIREMRLFASRARHSYNRSRIKMALYSSPAAHPCITNDRTILVGGFGVSGDGVDQDDVVTFAGQAGFEPLAGIRIDTYTIGGVRVPFRSKNSIAIRSAGKLSRLRRSRVYGSAGASALPVVRNFSWDNPLGLLMK